MKSGKPVGFLHSRFFHAWDSLSGLSSKGSLSPWLCTVLTSHPCQESEYTPGYITERGLSPFLITAQHWFGVWTFHHYMAIWTCHDHRLFELSTSLRIIFFQASRAKVPLILGKILWLQFKSPKTLSFLKQLFHTTDTCQDYFWPKYMQYPLLVKVYLIQAIASPPQPISHSY